MASNQTSNYGLNQWEAEDRVIREEFNGDNAKVDTALAGLAEKIETKAAQTEVDGIKTQLAAKAAQTEVNELRTQLAAKAAQTALDSLSSSMTAELAKKYGTDNSYLAAGDYTGDGAANKTVTVGFLPALVLLFNYDAADMMSSNTVFLIGDASLQNQITKNGSILMATDRISFSATGFTCKQGDNVQPYLNMNGKKYHYIAFR